MIDLDSKELAEVLWKTNQSQAGPLAEQGSGMQAVYARAADAVVAWLSGKAAERENRIEDCMHLLAHELAWKLLHPMQFSEAARTAFEDYAAIVGDGVPDEVKKAMKI